MKQTVQIFRSLNNDAQNKSRKPPVRNRVLVDNSSKLRETIAQLIRHKSSS